MKYLLALLLLASCAAQPKKEPWAAGDCVVYRPRELTGKIEGDPEFRYGEYFYKIWFFAEEKREKVFFHVPCPK